MTRTSTRASTRAADGARVPLRRADWRFLLPAPDGGAYEHLVLLGGPAGLAERLREAGVARRISGDFDGTAGADAVVVLRDAAVAPAVAARRVTASGVFYCEIDRRRPGMLCSTPAAVRRRLEAAGLRVLGAYWAVPDLEHARRYLPLDAADVLEWYFATLQTTGSPAALVAEQLVRQIVGGRWHRLASWVPCFGTVAVGGRRADPVPSVLAHPALPAAARTPGTRTAVLTSGQDDGSRVVLLPFPAGHAEPALVVKATRSPDFNVNTEREQLTLRGLRARLGPRLQDTVPEPLGVYPYGKLVVGLERCAPGPALVVSSGRWAAPLARAVDDLRAAAGWLADFHEQAGGAAERWDAGLGARVDARLEEYGRRLGNTAEETELVARVLGHSRALASAVISAVPPHNDFAPWNVHRAGARITVIDWELDGRGESARTGPPLCDLLYFATHWYHRVRHLRGDRAELRGLRELFLDRDGRRRAADEARAVVGEYMRRLAIDSRFLPLLLVHTWADRALDRADRGALAERGGVPRANRHREYVRLLAPHAGRLFAGPGTA